MGFLQTWFLFYGDFVFIEGDQKLFTSAQMKRALEFSSTYPGYIVVLACRGRNFQPAKDRIFNNGLETIQCCALQRHIDLSFCPVDQSYFSEWNGGWKRPKETRMQSFGSSSSDFGCRRQRCSLHGC